MLLGREQVLQALALPVGEQVCAGVRGPASTVEGVVLAAAVAVTAARATDYRALARPHSRAFATLHEPGRGLIHPCAAPIGVGQAGSCGPAIAYGEHRR